MFEPENFISIIHNTEKSSSELLLEVVTELDRITHDINSKNDFLLVIRNVSKVLSDGRKELPIFSLIADELQKFLSESGSLQVDQQKENLYSLFSSWIDVNKKTVQRAVKFFQELEYVPSILTISYSKLVKETIEKFKPPKVFICESRPLQEGARLARDLSKTLDNTEIILITDAEGSSKILTEADIVLLGMDAWFPDNSISNKTGSLALALAAHYANKPVYVLGNILKKVLIMPKDYQQMDKSQDLANKYPELNKAIAFETNYFEIIPANLLTRIIE